MDVFVGVAGSRGVELVTLIYEDAESWLDLWRQHYDDDPYYSVIPLPVERSYQGGKLTKGFRIGGERYTVTRYDMSL